MPSTILHNLQNTRVSSGLDGFLRKNFHCDAENRQFISMFHRVFCEFIARLLRAPVVLLGVDLGVHLGCGGTIAGVGSGQWLSPPAAAPGAQNRRPKKTFASMRPEGQETQVFQTNPELSVK